MTLFQEKLVILDFPVWMVGMPHLGFRENLVTVEFPDVMESMALKVDG